MGKPVSFSPTRRLFASCAICIALLAPLPATVYPVATISSGPADGASVALSEAEREYLRVLGPVRIAVDPDWEPYEYVASGQYHGIAADLVHLVFSRLQVPYRLVPTRDWNESLDASRDGRVHLLAFLNRTEERERWLTFTEAYFTDPNVFITRAEHPFISDPAGLYGERVALPYGTSMEERLRTDYPNIEILLVPNESDAFHAVEAGEADMALRSLTMAAYTIRQEGLFNLKIAGQIPGYANSFRMGVVKSESPLVSILDKGIATITPQDVQQVVNSHVAIELRTQVDRSTVIWIAFVVLLLLALGSLWIWLLGRVNRKLQAQDMALGQSQQMLRYIVEHLGSAVAVLDRDLRFVYVSDRYVQLFKLHGSLDGRLFGEVHGDEETVLHEGLRKAMDGIVSEGKEDRFRHPDGSVDWVHWEARPWYLDDTSIGGTVLYVENISLRKQAELDLQSSEELYRLLTEYTSDVIWVLNMRSGRFSYISPAVRQLRGYSVAQALGQDLQASLTPDSYERITRTFSVSLKEFLRNPDDPKTLYAEVKQPCKDGSEVWVEFSMKFRLNGKGEAEAVGVTRNIEERKRAEQAITYLSYHDQLTGVYNRRYYEEALPRYDDPKWYPLTLVMADLNGLKQANDTEGHVVGDAMLTAVARILRNECDGQDVVARIGGDEYVLLLPHTTAEEAERRITRIDTQVRAHRIGSRAISVSFGWATKDDAGITLANLFKSAEDMMYAKKRRERTSRTYGG